MNKKDREILELLEKKIDESGKKLYNKINEEFKIQKKSQIATIIMTIGITYITVGITIIVTSVSSLISPLSGVRIGEFFIIIGTCAFLFIFVYFNYFIKDK